MTACKLKKLSLDAFRGATQPVSIEFSGSKRLTLIFGENGCGKSSIVDALVFLCNKSLGWLDEVSEPEKEHLVAINRQRTDLRVQLETEARTWEGRIDGSGQLRKEIIRVTPDNVPPPPSVRILRRRQILNLVDTTAGDRYKALRDYIELPGIEKSEKALTDAKKQAEKEFKSARDVLSGAQQIISRLWKEANSPGESEHSWAASKEAEDTASIGKLSAIYGKLITAHDAIVERENEVSLELGKVTTAQADYDAAVEALKAAEQAAAGQSGDLVDLLERAKSYLDGKPDLEECPICEKPNDATALGAELGKRIQSMKAVRDAQAKLQATKKALDGRLAVYNSALDKHAKAILSLGKLLNSEEWKGQPKPASDEALTVWSDEAAKADERIKSFKDSATTWETQVTGLRTQVTTWKAVLDLQKQIKDALAIIRKNEEEVKTFDKLCALLKVAEETLIAERKKFVTRELASISDEAVRLYALIHPGEDLGGIKFLLKDNAKNSLVLAGDFYTEKGVPPQGIFSESHLDTLGLCVHFALAKKYGGEDSIVILDDVVASVDHDHLGRLIDVLHDEAENFVHVLLTTHYRPWKEKYLFNFAPKEEVHLLDLSDWSLASGIQCFKMLTAIEELRAKKDAKPMDRQAVASKAGILLERLLRFLNEAYGGRLPAKRGREGHSLGELAGGLKKDFLKKVSVEHFGKAKPQATDQAIKRVELLPLIEAIQNWVLRNQVGCHYNEFGALYSNAEIAEFGAATLALAEALVCPVGGDLPTKSGGAYWESKKGALRLHPLVKPD